MLFHFTSNVLFHFTSNVLLHFTSNCLFQFRSNVLFHFTPNVLLHFTSNDLFQFTSNVLFHFTPNVLLHFTSNDLFQFTSNVLFHFTFDVLLHFTSNVLLQFSLWEFPTCDPTKDYCTTSKVLQAHFSLPKAALDTPLVWVDDAFIYGIVRTNTLDVQIKYLDHIADTEEKYTKCVHAHGYRCKYWATNLDRSPQSSLLPSLLSLRADRLRYLSQVKTRRTPRGAPWVRDIAGRPDVLRRRRHMERMRLGGSGYVEEYECSNTKFHPKLLRDSRLSFPSGHASVSVYSAFFTVFYLQLRLDLKFSYLLKPLAQLGLVLLATFCCVTRITDHKHFVSDIAAGATIGSIFAWMTFYKLGMRVIPEAVTASKPRVLPRAVSVESEPQTPTPLLRPAAYVQARRTDFADKV
ncbi:hypothetical protein RRG08_007921 [Elysia crispata]|uniref:Phosphatidic acid phosphatase type 2/haloperoxidase domain-containing protein n=1 Tax=Elysia crispata TaxID=231223 RepID=A0AAE1DK46_9GAST|nr:hypothetical protein RRG08_007921 [Elysia crispata]